MPTWPYSYYYLGIWSGDAHCFKQAVNYFAEIRLANIREPEPLLYEAMSSTFLGDFDAARDRLADLAKLKISADGSHIPVLVISKNTPPELQAQFDSAATRCKMQMQRE